MLGNLGLLAGVTLLIYLALRGINIFIASLVCALVVALTNNMLISQTFLEFFPFGPLGAFTFAGKFFLLFLCGAIFGKVMATSQAAKSIALSITRALGVRHTLLVGMIVCALLTYGGVVVFVVVFTMYPLGITLMREANLPKRLWAACDLGWRGHLHHDCAAGNAVHSQRDFCQCAGYRPVCRRLDRHLCCADYGWSWHVVCGKPVETRQARGEGFVENAQDRRMEQLIGDPNDAPVWWMALIPMVVVLGSIMLPRAILGLVDWSESDSIVARVLLFSAAQPIIWPSILAHSWFADLRTAVSGLASQGGAGIRSGR